MRLLGLKCIVALIALHGMGEPATKCERMADFQPPSPENDPPPVPDFRPLRGNSPDEAKIRYGDAVIAWSHRQRHDRLTPQQEEEGELSSEERVLMKAREIVASVQDDEGDRLGEEQRERRIEAQNKVYKGILDDLLTYGGAGPNTMKSLWYALRVRRSRPCLMVMATDLPESNFRTSWTWS